MVFRYSKEKRSNFQSNATNEETRLARVLERCLVLFFKSSKLVLICISMYDMGRARVILLLLSLPKKSSQRTSQKCDPRPPGMLSSHLFF
jgi:hypothetical protein